MGRPIPALPWIEYWYIALNSPERGIRIPTTNFESLRQLLMTARKNSGDPQLDAYRMVGLPQYPGELWIVHESLLPDLNPKPTSIVDELNEALNGKR